MAKFNSTNNKLKDLWIQTENSENNISRLNQKSIKINRHVFSKKIVEISLFDGLLEQGGGGPIICWAAAAVFGGWMNPKTQISRYWIIQYSPQWFYNFYKKYGKKLSEIIKNNFIYRILFYPVFYFIFMLGSICYSRDKKNEI